MSCVRIADGILCLAAPDRTIVVNGHRYTFEMHSYLGPMVTTKRGDIAATQPYERSPFWNAVSLWARQGERIDADGLCVWEPETPRPMVKIGGVWFDASSEKSAREAMARIETRRRARRGEGR